MQPYSLGSLTTMLRQICWHCRFTALIMIFSFAPPARAAAPVPSDPQIAQLLQDLASPDFQTRESASQKLRELGPRAAPALTRAAESADPEVKARAGELVLNIAGDRGAALLKSAIWTSADYPNILYDKPVIAGGSVICIPAPNTIAALDAATGKKRWEIQWPTMLVRPGVERQREKPAPRLFSTGGATVLFGHASDVTALDGATGAEKWCANIPLLRVWTSVAIGDGLAIVATRHQLARVGNGPPLPDADPKNPPELHAYDLALGREKWIFTERDDQMPAVPVISGGLVWFTDSKAENNADGKRVAVGTITGLDSETGKLSKILELPELPYPRSDFVSRPLALPIVTGDTLALVTSKGEALAFDLTTLRLKWRTSIVADGNAGLSPVKINTANPLDEQPLIEKDQVLANIYDPSNGAETAGLAALDLATGKQRWYSRSMKAPIDPAFPTVPIRGYVSLRGPVIYQNLIIASTGSLGVVCISRENGQLLWNIRTGRNPFPPVIANGMLYLATDGDPTKKPREGLSTGIYAIPLENNPTAMTVP